MTMRHCRNSDLIYNLLNFYWHLLYNSLYQPSDVTRLFSSSPSVLPSSSSSFWPPHSTPPRRATQPCRRHHHHYYNYHQFHPQHHEHHHLFCTISSCCNLNSTSAAVIIIIFINWKIAKSSFHCTRWPTGQSILPVPLGKQVRPPSLMWLPREYLQSSPHLLTFAQDHQCRLIIQS